MVSVLWFVLYLLAMALPFKGWWVPTDSTPLDACADMISGLGVEPDPAQPPPPRWRHFQQFGRIGIVEVEDGSYWVRC